MGYFYCITPLRNFNFVIIQYVITRVRYEAEPLFLSNLYTLDVDIIEPLFNTHFLFEQLFI